MAKRIVVCLMDWVVLLPIAIALAACKAPSSPPAAPALTLPRSHPEWSAEEKSAVDCALRFAKKQSFYRGESEITVSTKRGAWVVHFVTSASPPHDRGIAFDVSVDMPVCQLVNIIVYQ
jgi:hypothetical protein